MDEASVTVHQHYNHSANQDIENQQEVIISSSKDEIKEKEHVENKAVSTNPSENLTMLSAKELNSINENIQTSTPETFNGGSASYTHLSSKLPQTVIHSAKEDYNEEFPDASRSQSPTEFLASKSDQTIEDEMESERYPENLNTSTSLNWNPDILKSRNIELYGPDVGPKMYDVKGKLVTPPVIAKNLPEMFNYLPIFGKPETKDDMETFYMNKIREFVGFDMNDEQFVSLAKFCSPDHLKTGKERRMTTPYPTLSVLSVFNQKDCEDDDSNLCIVKKHRLRVASDPANNYQKRLKYRGIRLMPLSQAESADNAEVDLEPGKDVIYRVRIYRPFPYNIKEKFVSSRHSVFSRDVVLLGRCRLSALRDRMTCANDAGVRVDASDHPDHLPATSAKDLFPSGFLFINNVFYVDGRAGCEDRSAPVRAWAASRGLGRFPVKDLHETRLEQLHIRLGHPEVYVHQGNCEHLFTFSEIRLLNANDPLSSSQYPCHTAVSQNQSVYCTTCAEFGAKWIVVGCETVPFDPAYFCDTCFKMYLYKDNKKIGDFKAYSYRGNEISMLKSQS